MAIRSLQEITEKFKGIVGNTDFSDSDEVVEFLEDLTDTYADATANKGDWESKYTELKKRYISRFGNNEIEDVSKDDTEDDESETKVLSYDEIFKEV